MDEASGTRGVRATDVVGVRRRRVIGVASKSTAQRRIEHDHQS